MKSRVSIPKLLEIQGYGTKADYSTFVNEMTARKPNGAARVYHPFEDMEYNPMDEIFPISEGI